jgi:hypothetical protein
MTAGRRQNPESQESPLPSWERFEQDYVEKAVPIYIVIREDPAIRVFVGNGDVLGAYFAVSENTSLPPSPLVEIKITEKREGSIRLVEIATSTSELHKHFYMLLVEIIDLVIQQNMSPLAAFEQCLRQWQALLRGLRLMTEEQQLGLLGELWMLDRLTWRLGRDTLTAWTGHDREPHDFRLENNEFEVKVTRNARRLHIIHGLGQLQPSSQRQLFILSLQLAPAGPGSGFSLPERVRQILRSFAQWPSQAASFVRILDEKHNFQLADERHYERRWQMRTDAYLVPVKDGCPRLVSDALERLPSTYAVNRISNVSYTVDLDGLGYSDGHEIFMSALPCQNNSTGAP